MIEPLEIIGEKYEVTDRITKYTQKKIGGLDHYIPRNVKKSVSGEVRLRQINGENGDKYEVEAMINLPEKNTLIAKDQAPNIFAAVDIVQTKLLGQIRRYKTEHQQKPRRVQSFIKRFRRVE